MNSDAFKKLNDRKGNYSDEDIDALFRQTNDLQDKELAKKEKQREKYDPFNEDEFESFDPNEN
ncbi:hypothetical protein Lqui_0689 [Legionella quinlivanii]|uniref:Uncharacterized protein n=1 Tax=Legionella quinlivanii TaxID=45073 RepID=A0A0W0Y4U5_9GAMM|nr:hypothetical protein [Legionella quinlivanii]KTD51845.1 hypothetical protein Lqui_0689 [Legionella quinlivanii]MCW8452105.1 hypothetical protein [Legionella quinlivanii]SEF82736.1 hypothetical protein SAMN02746093_01148 [Legionella quinlivanii DSM 21216]STY09694.1 Uncharacterised protein [Legionella quinlivanii]